MTPVEWLDVVVNGALVAIDVAIVALVWRRREQALRVCVWAAVTAFAVALALGFGLGHQPFAAMRALAWALFAHGPVDLLVAAALSFRVGPRSAAALAVAALGTIGVGIDAFFVEPQAVDGLDHFARRIEPGDLILKIGRIPLRVKMREHRPLRPCLADQVHRLGQL